MLTPTSYPAAPPARSLAPRAASRMRSRAFPRTALVVLGLWIAWGIVGALTSVLIHLPPPLLPLLIWTPVGIAALAYRTRPALRDALLAVGLRPLILFHSVRALIGASFLLNGARGILPPAFATPAGWGDLIVGLLAVPAALAAWRPSALPTPARRRVVALWNTVAFADILLAFGSAQRLIFFVHDLRMRTTLGSWPNALVPLLIVPAVLATHLLVFAHLSRWRSPSIG